jgi:hypothetical protein
MSALFIPGPKLMPLSPTIAPYPLALPLPFVLSLLSINTVVSLYSLLRKRRTECPKVAVILLDSADGLGRAIKAGRQSLLKS